MDATRARVVFVDDHPDSLEAFSMVLRERYVVFGYPSAVEALRGIDAARPNVLILDIGMRPIDGVQCLEMIRAIPEYRLTPALALTGFGRDVERQRFLDAGFQAVVVKPVLEVDELMAVIDELLKAAAPPVAPDPMPLDHTGGLPMIPPPAVVHLDAEAPLRACPADAAGATDERGCP